MEKRGESWGFGEVVAALSLKRSFELFDYGRVDEGFSEGYEGNLENVNAFTLVSYFLFLENYKQTKKRKQHLFYVVNNCFFYEQKFSGSEGIILELGHIKTSLRTYRGGFSYFFNFYGLPTESKPE